jgi:NAD(P)-dependent dehydrogenase (short-subunit alcohol dehydrogenase family)
MSNINKKIIVIFGATGIIGNTLFKYFDDRNNFLCISVSRHESNNDNHFIANITNEESINNLINNLKKKYLKIDAVINCAYPAKNINKNKETYDIFCNTIVNHIGGFYLVTSKFIKFFINQGYGNIINFSSIYGVNNPKFEIYSSTDKSCPLNYCCSKASIIMMTKYYANMLKKKNIRINTISPGGIISSHNNNDTVFTEKYKSKCSNYGLLQPSDLIGTVELLLSEKSKYINGQNIIIDDGFTL